MSELTRATADEKNAAEDTHVAPNATVRAIEENGNRGVRFAGDVGQTGGDPSVHACEDLKLPARRDGGNGKGMRGKAVQARVEEIGRASCRERVS